MLTVVVLVLMMRCSFCSGKRVLQPAESSPAHVHDIGPDVLSSGGWY
jgi:hypothetical protein